MSRSSDRGDGYWRFAARYFVTGPYSIAVALLIVLVGALLGGLARALEGEAVGFVAAPIGVVGLWGWCKWFDRTMKKAYDDECESRRRASQWPPRNSE